MGWAMDGMGDGWDAGQGTGMFHFFIFNFSTLLNSFLKFKRSYHTTEIDYVHSRLTLPGGAQEKGFRSLLTPPTSLLSRSVFTSGGYATTTPAAGDG